MTGMSLFLLIFWLLIPNTAKGTNTKCMLTPSFLIREKWEYYSSGDLIIGGNLALTAMTSFKDTHFKKFPTLLPDQFSPIPKNYQQVMALAFAVREVNKHLGFLQNMTLGFHIDSNMQFGMSISSNSLSLLSTRNKIVPGYKCDRQDPLLSVIGGLSSKSSRQMASIFSNFKVPQVGKLHWIQDEVDQQQKCSQKPKWKSKGNLGEVEEQEDYLT